MTHPTLHPMHQRRLAALLITLALAALALSGCASDTTAPVDPPTVSIEPPVPAIVMRVVCPSRVSYWYLIRDDEVIGTYAFGAFGLHDVDVYVMRVLPGVHRLSWAEFNGFAATGGQAIGNSGTITTDSLGVGSAELRCLGG